MAGRKKSQREENLVASLAKQNTKGAIKKLAHLMEHAASETAQVAAANAILDRGHGKPEQAIAHNNLPPYTININGVKKTDSLKSESAGT